jgi:non-lysosomal glucosylceramidase
MKPSPEPQLRNRRSLEQTECCEEISRRSFVKTIGMAGATAVAQPTASAQGLIAAEQASGAVPNQAQLMHDSNWPSLKLYDQAHLARIALPLGGIGTGTVSLGGRGDLRDWEIMNRPAKGFVPADGDIAPFFALFTRIGDAPPVCRILEGPLEHFEYEGSHGSTAPKHNLPRFRHCSFGAAYPLGRVMLSDPEVPLEVHLKAYNPLVPADPDSSGIPLAILTYEVRNISSKSVSAAICASLPNFIGMDGWETRRDWKGDSLFAGAVRNRNEYREARNFRGIFMRSEGVDPKASTWGTLALATTSPADLSYRVNWKEEGWGSALLDFWDDFSADGRIEARPAGQRDMPIASLAAGFEVAAGSSMAITFLLAWHFPNRYTWTPRKEAPVEEEIIGNWYARRYRDAWDALEDTVPRLDALKTKTLNFVNAFCSSSLPAEVKEAALFNLSTLRTQTCFRTPDGRFFGWEGSSNRQGCCHGSCTHVWNYEQATAFLFGGLAMTMREVEFEYATAENGLMSFRVHLPLGRGRDFGKAAADGQMGCIMKMFRDWQLSGDDRLMRRLWPRVRKALEFCWIPGGWDADQDGVMEGCQHNTMDVEYYGPNPQMGAWYLGALRAAEEMARYLQDAEFAATCRRLFEKGSRWIDAQLFNGEYYEHRIQPPADPSAVAPSLRVGMGSRNLTRPDYQLGAGCLVDQLVGQFMAHVCGLGYLLKPENVRTTLRSILKYNLKEDVHDHFNCMRSFALGSESALLMAGYPKDRPENPFPYFTEAMTGFEYAAAVGMLYESMPEEGLRCIRYIRQRYDGAKRSPFDEAECGHHYARAMASWAAILALTGFHYSAVTREMTFSPVEGRHFWSNGYAWGECRLAATAGPFEVRLTVLHGRLDLRRFTLRGIGSRELDGGALEAGADLRFVLARASS